jgi:hypothetical protein
LENISLKFGWENISVRLRLVFVQGGEYAMDNALRSFSKLYYFFKGMVLWDGYETFQLKNQIIMP